MSIDIKELNIRNATEEELSALNKCRNQIRLEIFPDDPPIPLEEAIQGFRNIPDYIGIIFWAATRETSMNIVGYGIAQFSDDDNLHALMGLINILPDYRRQGLGKDFLSKIVGVAKKENRRLLILNTFSRIPAGQAFLRRIGAEKRMEEHINQLVIADLDLKLIRQWRERAIERGKDFEPGIWKQAYPDEYMNAIIELHDLINQQPFGDLEVEESKYTAENIREDEKSLFARGYKRWTIFMREKQTGRFAGYTEVTWNPNRPDVIEQGITGVFPKYRNKGLGRWLKAEMLDKIIKEHPQAKFVRTQNSDANAPMVKINDELGFKPYTAKGTWQVEIDKVAEYLAD